MRHEEGFRPEALRALYAIEKKCFPAGQRWTWNQFRTNLKLSTCWTAYAANTKKKAWPLEIPVGLIVTWAQDGEGYIASLGVDPKWRGTGVGTELLGLAENFYRAGGFKSVVLAVLVDNPAQKMYFDRGYRVFACRKRPGGSASVKMRKML